MPVNNFQLSDFQVIILAGGSCRRLFPINLGNKPKCLLPIDNRPILSYQLEVLEKIGVKDVIVVINEQFYVDLVNYLDSTENNIKIDLVSVSDYSGTADILVQIKDKITKDFIVISGDLIVEDRFINIMTDMHRSEDASCTILIYPKIKQKRGKGADDVAINDVTDYIGLSGNRLLFSKSSSDMTENNILVKKSLLRKFPNFTLNTSYRDAHFYIFSHWVLQILERKESNITSIRSHLIPYLIRCQYRKNLIEGINTQPYVLSSVADLSAHTQNTNDKVKCLAYLVTPNVSYCCRANTIEGYTLMNKAISEGRVALFRKNKQKKQKGGNQQQQQESKKSKGEK